MSINLKPETEARINALAAASGVPVDDYLAALVKKQSTSEGVVTGPREPTVNRSPRHVWEIIAENMKDVPPEDFAALPTDGLGQIDHYVYGVPKRTP
jgi:hypothetical protein